MEEIKVGEYVRTKIGDIYKIQNLNDYDFLRDKFYCLINKHSKNIIDLIEAGDIVGLIDKDNKIHYYEVYDNTAMYQYQIKSIVTKEMMKSVEYRVETD